MVSTHTYVVAHTRTQRPPASFDSGGVAVLTKNEKDKTYVYNGYATSSVTWTLHDGTTNQFGSAPPYVRKQFKSVASIRTHMNVDVSSKVFAMVLSDYKSKGVHQYEVSNVKMRSGFGKSEIKHIPPAATKAADVQRMFGGASVKASPETTETVPESTSSSTVQQGLEVTTATTTMHPDVSSGGKVSEQDDVNTESTKSDQGNIITTETGSQAQTAVPTQPVASDVT